MDGLIERLQAVGMSPAVSEMVAGAARLADAVAVLEARMAEQQQRHQAEADEQTAIIGQMRAEANARMDEQAQEALAREAGAQEQAGETAAQPSATPSDWTATAAPARPQRARKPQKQAT